MLQYRFSNENFFLSYIAKQPLKGTELQDKPYKKKGF